MSAYRQVLTVTIPELIERHSEQQVPLTLTRSFKGVMLNQEVKILTVCANYAVFEACDIKPFAEASGLIYLHSSLLEKPLRAQLLGRDMSQCRITLSDFSFSPVPWTERQDRRVQPKVPVYLPIRSGRNAILATLLDVQANGIGILCNKFSLEMAELGPGSAIHSTFHLPPNLSFKKLEGSIAYIKPMSKTVVRLGIRIYPKQDQLQQLQRYIDRRQDEILEELDQSYFLSIGPRRVEELYF